MCFVTLKAISFCLFVCFTVNGGWSAWSAWSECDCDLGVDYIVRNRTCNNPEPEGYGSPCLGEPTDSMYCCSKYKPYIIAIAFIIAIIFYVWVEWKRSKLDIATRAVLLFRVFIRGSEWHYFFKAKLTLFFWQYRLQRHILACTFGEEVLTYMCCRSACTTHLMSRGRP